MQFQHPGILYALFLLIVPIIVHFFRLRRFKREEFTNVKFLKKAKLQTRKSARLKKWLTLFARLLALTALILAFARPFIPHSDAAMQPKKTVVYIDNSFSMQQKGEGGPLLQMAVQKLLQEFPDERPLTVLTNDQIFKESRLSDLQNDLLDIDYSPVDASLKTTALKAKTIFAEHEDSRNQFMAISDFQRKNLEDEPKFDKTTEVDFIQLEGKNHLNFSIDSVYSPPEKMDGQELKLNISASRENSEKLPVELYRDDQLVSKNTAEFDKDSLTTTKFNLSDENKNFEGHFSISDNSLQFDNDFYFSLQNPQAIKVVSIGTDKANRFLKKIFDPSEFDVKTFNSENLDYNALEDANYIVLNQLETIPGSLHNSLKNHVENGGTLTLIPDLESDTGNYNALLSQLQSGRFSGGRGDSLKITTINFSHPLFDGVFEDEVTNFQYPKVKNHLDLTTPGSHILTYNNGRPFLAEKDGVYVFSAALDKANSNFKNSPLVVPVFYNMARQGLKLPQLFYTIGEENEMTIPAEVGDDEVLHLKRDGIDFIPQQHSFNDKVDLTTKNKPEEAGNYGAVKNGESIAHVSFNYDRSENSMDFARASEFDEGEMHESVANFLTEEINKNDADQLWKWFVIFAGICLLAEIALLKFFK